jgi:hypothetical protein
MIESIEEGEEYTCRSCCAMINEQADTSMSDVEMQDELVQECNSNTSSSSDAAQYSIHFDTTQSQHGCNNGTIQHDQGYNTHSDITQQELQYTGANKSHVNVDDIHADNHIMGREKEQASTSHSTLKDHRCQKASATGNSMPLSVTMQTIEVLNPTSKPIEQIHGKKTASNSLCVDTAGLYVKLPNKTQQPHEMGARRKTADKASRSSTHAELYVKLPTKPQQPHAVDVQKKSSAKAKITGLNFRDQLPDIMPSTSICEEQCG